MQVPTMSNNNRSSTDIRSRVTRGKLEDGEQISFFLFFFFTYPLPFYSTRDIEDTRFSSSSRFNLEKSA